MNAEQLIERTCCGDALAVEFLTRLVSTIHIWDDLVDGDKLVPPATVTVAFMNALFELPENLFFRRNEGVLRPIMRKAAMDWMVATNMERAKVGRDYEITFIIRSAYIDVFTMIAYLTGGQGHAVTLGPELRHAFHHEGLAGYAAGQRGFVREVS